MGHNVQSQAGETVTDVYDVRGGQAPIERIITADVQATHDMATTIASERFSMFIRRTPVAAVNQSSNINVTMTDLPAGVARILNVWVEVDDASRLDHLALSIQTSAPQRGMPFWIWDGTNADTVRMFGTVTDGVINNATLLRQAFTHTRLPLLLTHGDQPQAVPDIFMGGVSTAFGAGTVEVTLGVLLAFSAIGGISSRGLPIPSW